LGPGPHQYVDLICGDATAYEWTDSEFADILFLDAEPDRMFRELVRLVPHARDGGDADT
jgi:hypothetical protein